MSNTMAQVNLKFGGRHDSGYIGYPDIAFLAETIDGDSF
jgi:hypothetical protein